MATGIPFRARNRFEEYIESLRKVSYASAGMRRGGSAALDLAYVACGRFEGFWEINLSPWDIAAGELLVLEAGGHITDVWGRGDFIANGDVLASNRSIHGELQAITSGIFTPKP
jgi:myo-inositol-1(or 4)-monophosphatase